MSDLTDTFVDLAVDLIAEFGGPCMLRPRAGAFDPEDGSRTAPSIPVSITAIVAGYRKQLGDGTSLEAGDVVAYVAAYGLTFAVEPGCHFCSGAVWSDSAALAVVAVNELRPDPSTVAAYEIALRR